jgi:hypothetical protein
MDIQAVSRYLDLSGARGISLTVLPDDMQGTGRVFSREITREHRIPFLKLPEYQFTLMNNKSPRRRVLPGTPATGGYLRGFRQAAPRKIRASCNGIRRFYAVRYIMAG